MTIGSQKKIWTKEAVVEELLKLNIDQLTNKELKKNRSLYNACMKLFGSRRNALKSAGLNYEDTLLNLPWTKDRVLSTIQMLHLNGVPLNFKFISTYHSKLRNSAEKFFGSWGNAVDEAGLNYEEIKKNKGWSKPYLGKDGILYSSQEEGEIGDKLFKLKSKSVILGYTHQEYLPSRQDLCCDFSIILKNNAKLWLDIEILGDAKRRKKLEDKTIYYEKYKYLHHKLTIHNNLENIIDRYNSWYTIPELNTLITTHKDPDGDALASSRAIYNYLQNKGKRVAIKFHGEVPKNLNWIIEDIEIVKKLPNWAENIIVLDCAPTKERIGWEIPNNIRMINIDHHNARINENNPDNGIHVLDYCSTASLLYRIFGIKEDILVVGAYTDTLFTKRTNEVFSFINDFGMDEKILDNYLTKINSNPDRKIWDLLNKAKVHRFKNGFLMAEIEENPSPDVIEALAQILFKLSESICLIYGKDKNVKLRTSNPNLDVGEIARSFSGGGHPYASMCQVNGKSVEFKNLLKSLEIQKEASNFE